jgi:hypothetical protein
MTLIVLMAKAHRCTRFGGAPFLVCAVVACMAVCASRPVQAEVPADVSTRLVALQPAFQAMYERHQAARTYPSLNDAADATVLKQLWDRPGLLGAQPYSRASIEPALEILQIQNVVLRSFRQHAEAGDAGQRGGAQNEDITVAAQEMILHTTAVVAQAVQGYMQTVPADTLSAQARAELTRVRTGFTSLPVQMLEAFQVYQFSLQNVERLTGALAETSAHIFPTIPLGQRPELERALQRGKSKVGPGAAVRLDGMLEVLRLAPCGQVCTLN